MVMIFDKNKESKNNLKIIDEVLTNDEFDSLRVHFKNLDLKVKAGDKFEVRYHGSKCCKPKASLDNGILTLTQTNAKNKETAHWETTFFKIEINYTRGNQVTVTIPRDKNLDELDEKTMSGDIQLENIDLNQIKIESVSGDLKLKTVKTNSITVKIASGDIKMNEVRLDEGKLDLKSGDFELSDSRINRQLKASTISGDNIVKNTQVATCQLSTVTGDNEIMGKEADNGKVGEQDGSLLELNSVSGDNQVK